MALKLNFTHWLGLKPLQLIPLILSVALLSVRSILHLENSLWLDETITAWVVKDGLRELIARSINYQGQSPLYFLAPWISTHIFGLSESSLRLPSLVCNLITVVALYRLFLQLAGTTAATYGASAFAIIASSNPELQSARPYALAVCCFALCLLFLVRWALAANWLELLCFALSACGVFYAHYLFGLGFLLFPVILVFLGKKRIIGLSHLMTAALLISLCAVPAAHHLRLLSAKASLYSFSDQPTFISWLNGVHLDWSTITLVCTVCILWLANHRLRGGTETKFRYAVQLALCMWAYPRLALVIASILSHTPVLVSRYGSYQVVGESLIQGLAISSITHKALRLAIFLAAAATSILCTPSSIFFGQDWRAALSDIPLATTEPSVALIWTGLIETKNHSWVLDPYKREYLMTPTSIYPVAVKTFPIPLTPSVLPDTPIYSDYDQSIIDRAKKVFIITASSKDLIELGAGDTTIHVPWLHSSELFRVVSLKQYLGVSVFTLQREIAPIG